MLAVRRDTSGSISETGRSGECCTAMECSKFAQQRADNRVNPVSGIRAVTMDIVGDFAVAVYDQMTRINWELGVKRQ